MADNKPKDDRFPRTGGRFGPQKRARLCAHDRWSRSENADLQRSRRAWRPRASIWGARAHRDPDLPAPRAARRLFPRRHAHGGKPLSTPAASWSAVDFGIMGRFGAEERRFLARDSSTVISRATTCARRARVHFEAGYVPRTTISVEGFAQAIRESASRQQPHPRRNSSMAKS